MSRSEFSRRAALQHWATVASTVTVLGVSAHKAVARPSSQKNMSVIKTNPREIKGAKLA
jgi:hypothetical protein